tara:strand:- start:803 stop:1984 length:1182 start_codon:yes stop_codon:yes gene_type:complete
MDKKIFLVFSFIVISCSVVDDSPVEDSSLIIKDGYRFQSENIFSGTSLIYHTDEISKITNEYIAHYENGILMKIDNNGEDLPYHFIRYNAWDKNKLARLYHRQVLSDIPFSGTVSLPSSPPIQLTYNDGIMKKINGSEIKDIDSNILFQKNINDFFIDNPITVDMNLLDFDNEGKAYILDVSSNIIYTGKVEEKFKHKDYNSFNTFHDTFNSFKSFVNTDPDNVLVYSASYENGILLYEIFHFSDTISLKEDIVPKNYTGHLNVTFSQSEDGYILTHNGRDDYYEGQIEKLNGRSSFVDYDTKKVGKWMLRESSKHGRIFGEKIRYTGVDEWGYPSNKVTTMFVSYGKWKPNNKVIFHVYEGNLLKGKKHGTWVIKIDNKTIVEKYIFGEKIK